ncbi:curved DNA-binding protein [Suhomyces tanzawaensis NRRL Y-17324]|uniref:Curved DNA-binding protein n=1 Tax=Suhomyces tanzawaensis NRRL Y-17324 TaxID=984487 RepID=A0A1E4SRZ9_9ASCO|nr:curved DNA-binding protein [Suhomyces tanzawaensis NRRL Y-17324]ODV82281.1 curved DNA-binding protein [Suhomyces tanzawaensis NRRL Y-17324]
MSAKTPDYTIANSDVVSKYKTGGDITNRVLQQVKELVVDGATTYEISIKGDELLNEELSKIYNSKKTSKVPKGIAFPTCVNPNHFPAHIAPIDKDDEANITLKTGDVVNVMLGVQLDGFPAIVADTVVVGSKDAPVDGKKADLVHAAWLASEAALRTFKPNKKNWDVTNIVAKVAKEFDTTPVESMLTHNIERNVLYGAKEVILNPSKQNKEQMDTHKFEENEVYGLDILISTSADGKVKASELKTNLYKLTGTSYALKLKMSHKVLGDVRKTSTGPFPFNVRTLEEPKKARSGLHEPVNHKVMLAYDIFTEKEGEYIAQYFTTFGITKNGIVKYTSPVFEEGLYNTDKKIQDEEILKLLEEPLKVEKKKKAKAAN